MAASNVSSTIMLDPKVFKRMISESVPGGQPKRKSSYGRTHTILETPIVILEPWVLVGCRDIADVSDKRKPWRARRGTTTQPRPIVGHEARKEDETYASNDDAYERRHRGSSTSTELKGAASARWHIYDSDPSVPTLHARSDDDK